MVRTLDAVGERDDELVAVALEAGDRVHEGEVRPEDPGLVVRRPGEPPAADAAWEPEVVADERAGGRLAADAALVDHQRAEALPRRRTRRPTALPVRRRR